MSGLMGSDVKIYHNLQFARPSSPPVMMLLAGSLSLVTNRMNEWAALSGGEGGRGCLPGAGGNHGHLVIRARITQSWPRNKHQPQTKLCYALKPMKWLDVHWGMYHSPRVWCFIMSNVFMVIFSIIFKMWLTITMSGHFSFQDTSQTLTWEANGW